MNSVVLFLAVLAFLGGLVALVVRWRHGETLRPVTRTLLTIWGGASMAVLALVVLTAPIRYFAMTRAREAARLERIQEAEEKLAELRTRYKDEHPSVAAQMETVESLRRLADSIKDEPVQAGQGGRFVEIVILGLFFLILLAGIMGGIGALAVLLCFRKTLGARAKMWLAIWGVGGVLLAIVAAASLLLLRSGLADRGVAQENVGGEEAACEVLLHDGTLLTGRLIDFGGRQYRVRLDSGEERTIPETEVREVRFVTRKGE